MTSLFLFCYLNMSSLSLKHPSRQPVDIFSQRVVVLAVKRLQRSETKPRLENGFKSGYIKNLRLQKLFHEETPGRSTLRRLVPPFARVLSLRNVVAFFRIDARIVRKETFGIWSGSSAMDGWSGCNRFFGS